MKKNPYFILAFASLCWSGNHIVGRAIAGHFPPLTISTIRWFIPAIILWIAGRSRIEQDWPLICRHWVVMLWLGATGGILFSALQYVGLQYTSAVNVSILNSLVPVLIIAASALIFRDRILPIQLLGILTSLIGVLIIVTRGNLNALLQLSFNHGDVIIIVNMIVFAIYAAYLRLRPKIHWMSFLFVLAVVSAVGTMPFAIFELASGRIPELNVGTIAAALYVSIFPSLVAFAAWNYGVEHIGANRSGPFLHLIPLYTALLASIFLGEELMIFHALGLLMILVGVWIAARGQASPQSATQGK
jgi:drug/metabolite transporter (DMT)-like permease